MPGLLFVSQAMLDSWAEQGKIDFVGNVMTLVAGEGKGRSYALDPAVRFLEVLGADADPNQLLRKVKSMAQLRELAAEAVNDSVVLGDVAYRVEPGFLAEASALQAAATAAPTARRPEHAPQVPGTGVPGTGVPGTVEPQAPGTAVPGTVSAGAGSGKPVAPPSGARPAGRPLGATPLPKELEARRKEAEALARFLLENLS